MAAIGVMAASKKEQTPQTVHMSGVIKIDCAWITRRQYIQSRRLVSRLEVRRHMHIWKHFFSCVRNHSSYNPSDFFVVKSK